MSDNPPKNLFKLTNILVVIGPMSLGLFLGWLFFSVTTAPKPTTFSFNEVVSLSISIALGVGSLVLGIFSIWLTMHLKSESDSLNEETKKLLADIKVDAKTISNGVFGEMQKWGDFGRENLAKQNTAKGEATHIISELNDWGANKENHNTAQGKAHPINSVEKTTRAENNGKNEALKAANSFSFNQAHQRYKKDE